MHKNGNRKLKYLESTFVDLDNAASFAHSKVLLSEIVTARRFCIDSFDWSDKLSDPFDSGCRSISQGRRFQ